VITYRYKFELGAHNGRLGGRTATGRLQSFVELSQSEVETLAKEMANGILDGAKMVECGIVRRSTQAA
jgi:hypothetical protein